MSNMHFEKPNGRRPPGGTRPHCQYIRHIRLIARHPSRPSGDRTEMGAGGGSETMPSILQGESDLGRARLSGASNSRLQPCALLPKRQASGRVGRDRRDHPCRRPILAPDVEPAGEETRGEFGPDEGGREAEVLEDALGSAVAAADGPLHGCRPAGRGPVARQEESVDRRPLGRPQGLDARADGERRPVLGDDPPAPPASPRAPTARSRPVRRARRRGSRSCRAPTSRRRR